MAAIPLIPKSMLLLLCFTALFQVTFATSKPTGLSMRLIRRDFLYPGNLTKAERLKRLIRFSVSRGQYLDSASSPNSTANPDNVRVPLGRVPDDWLYVAETKIGSRLHPVKLVMDTGGALIWSQCQPCVSCYNQTAPIYDSRASTSYRKLPCSHPLCQGANRRFDCYNNQCIYDVTYGAEHGPDSPRTRGVASFESFQFPVDNVHTRVITGIIFGCSYSSEHFDFTDSEISGIIGFSTSPESFPTQLASRGIAPFRFSYCLVPFDEDLERPSFVRFGDDIPRPVGNLQTTGLLALDGSFYYNLELLDISVGSHRLGFQPDMFRVRQDGSGGCFIDSGCLISNLDEKTIGRNAYHEVFQVFQAYYDSRGFERTGPVVESLPLCYHIKPASRDYATMIFHLSGADYQIDGKYAHYFNEEDGYFCVALTPASKTILGSWHQQNMRIIYDRNMGALQWVTAACADDVP